MHAYGLCVVVGSRPSSPPPPSSGRRRFCSVQSPLHRLEPERQEQARPSVNRSDVSSRMRLLQSCWLQSGREWLNAVKAVSATGRYRRRARSTPDHDARPVGTQHIHLLLAGGSIKTTSATYPACCCGDESRETDDASHLGFIWCARLNFCTFDIFARTLPATRAQTRARSGEC